MNLPVFGWKEASPLNISRKKGISLERHLIISLVNLCISFSRLLIRTSSNKESRSIEVSLSVATALMQYHEDV